MSKEQLVSSNLGGACSQHSGEYVPTLAVPPSSVLVHPACVSVPAAVVAPVIPNAVVLADADLTFLSPLWCFVVACIPCCCCKNCKKWLVDKGKSLGHEQDIGSSKEVSV